MKHSVSYSLKAMPSMQLNSFRRSEITALEAALKQLRKDLRWRKFVLGTCLLLGCAYAALLVVFSEYDCSTGSVSSYSSGDADSAYCKLAAWSNSVNLRRSTTWPLSADGSSNVSHRPLAGMSDAKGTSLSRIVFGIGASAALWEKRKEYIKLWWKPSGIRGFVWADDKLEPWEEGDPPHKVSEDTSRFGYTNPMNARAALRIARIVGESYRLHLPSVDWFVMGDDDTVFFPDNLVRVLSKYDHTKFHYIGSSSEDVRQAKLCGPNGRNFAYGGGGFAISHSLAKALSEIQDECNERYTGLYGSDERVKACVSELGVPLTKEPGFHQLDLRGDISGLLAAHPVSPIVSLHHVGGISPLFRHMTNLEALKRLMEAVDVSSAAIFQQSICYDEAMRWTFVVAWGYLVEIYEGFVPPRHLEVPATSFLSFGWSQEFEAFTVDTRPVYEEVCRRPDRFFMVSANASGTGRDKVGVTLYDRLTELEDAHCEAKSAPVGTLQTVRVVNEPMSENWYLNPRRQCCRVKQMSPLSLDIEVGDCRETESLVPRQKKQIRR